MEQQPQQKSLTDSGKVRVNPFVHILRGNKNLFTTNARSAILAGIISAATGIGMSILSVYLLSSSLKNLSPVGQTMGSSFTGILIKVIVFWLITSLITGYFAELIYRTVLTGTRRERVSFSSILPFVARRYVKAVLTVLVVGGVFVLGIAVIIGVGFIQPILALLAMVVVGLFLVIFALRMTYVLFVVVDDEQPQSVSWILRRSSSLWKKSRGALIVYYLLLIVLGIIISILSASHSSSPPAYNSIQPTSSINVQPAIVYSSLIIPSLLEGVIILIISAAIGDIYNQARLAVDGSGPAAEVANGRAAIPGNMPVATMPSTQSYPTATLVSPNSLSDSTVPSLAQSATMQPGPEAVSYAPTNDSPVAQPTPSPESPQSVQAPQQSPVTIYSPSSPQSVQSPDQENNTTPPTAS